MDYYGSIIWSFSNALTLSLIRNFNQAYFKVIIYFHIILKCFVSYNTDILLIPKMTPMNGKNDDINDVACEYGMVSLFIFKLKCFT